MKIRRFSGTDMRDALRQVREALGPDAVILETVRQPTGVEVSAAVDAATASTRSAATPASWTDAALEQDADDVIRTDDGPLAPGHWYQPPRPPAAATASELDRMREEMRSIRSLLEAQLGRLIWDDQARQTPAIAGLLHNFSRLGLAPDIARRLAAEAVSRQPSGGWTAGLRTLVDRLPVAGNDVVTDGGVYAVVGPTGVGKTTTIAKLAARAALQYGPEAIGLITTDTFRVAAREQLETFGQIMGVTVMEATDSQSLGDVLATLESRRLVLVDTAGMSQRDVRLQEQLARLSTPAGGVATLLALPANVEAGTLQEIVDVFRTARPAGCILTKADETASLGGPLSVLIRSELPLAYVANGQRVPEDLHWMHNRQAWLAKMAVELMRRDTPALDADDLARRFTEVTTHAYA